jgi:DedD protein
MGAFSIFGKNKQVEASSDGEFYSHAEETPTPRRRSKRRAEEPDPASDPALQEKKRARRRLVGAVALVLAAIIGLPMILDSEPKPLASDIAIQIPSKDKPATAQTPLQREPADNPSSMPPPDRLAPSETDSGDAAGEPAPEAVKARVENAPAGPAFRTIPKNLESSAPAAKQTSASRPEVQASAEKPKTDSAGKGGRFVVQVAALASQEKATEVQNRLKGAGIKSFTQKLATPSGDRIRIRVGPFANRDEADRMRAKLTKLGYSTTLVPL